jgi:hypothetical protein
MPDRAATFSPHNFASTMGKSFSSPSLQPPKPLFIFSSGGEAVPAAGRWRAAWCCKPSFEAVIHFSFPKTGEELPVIKTKTDLTTVRETLSDQPLPLFISCILKKASPF